MAAGARFGEDGRRLDYSTYLRVPELLALQTALTSEHDELLFIVTHQVYELWFKQLLAELEAARDALDADDLDLTRHHFRRVGVIEKLLIAQVDVLETMTPQDFARFRSELFPASGFQSVQFREVEFLSGLKDPAFLERIDASGGERARLERRLAERTVWDAFTGALVRAGGPSYEELFHRRDLRGLLDVGEALLDHDEAFVLWRSRHVLMVERQIGSKPGTGGSTGAGYLRSTLTKRFYPELWAARSAL